jgi:hypothetical protein
MLPRFVGPAANSRIVGIPDKWIDGLQLSGTSTV